MVVFDGFLVLEFPFLGIFFGGSEISFQVANLLLELILLIFKALNLFSESLDDFLLVFKFNLKLFDLFFLVFEVHFEVRVLFFVLFSTGVLEVVFDLEFLDLLLQ